MMSFSPPKRPIPAFPQGALRSHRPAITASFQSLLQITTHICNELQAIGLPCSPLETDLLRLESVRFGHLQASAVALQGRQKTPLAKYCHKLRVRRTTRPQASPGPAPRPPRHPLQAACYKTWMATLLAWLCNAIMLHRSSDALQDWSCKAWDKGQWDPRRACNSGRGRRGLDARR